MQYRYLGKDKLKVSALGLGCMGFTQSYPPYLPENEAIFVLQQAVDLGINFFDTAEVYAQRLIRRWRVCRCDRQMWWI